MRLIRFRNSNGPALGVVDGDSVVDLTRVAPSLPTDVSELLRLGPAAREEAAAAAARAGADARHALDGVTYLPPAMRAGKIICLGLNYVDHAAESGREKPTYPVLFYRGATSLVAHGEPIVRPRCSDKLDYEGELVAFIGKTARHVSRADALSIVAGYSVFNDGSIRDYQRKTPQWTVGKNFDGTGGFGPAFVSADTLPPGAKGLSIQTRLNGQVMQDATTTDMIFDVTETIALITECMTLEAGDILVMGTPSGVGAARKPPVFMKAGDVVEVEIEGVGLLRNPVVDEA